MSGYQRDEDEAAQLDRHWNELLQELRIAQAGTQILFAFLLTIAFTQPFRDSDRFTHVVFGGTLVTAATALGLFLAPVPFHRMLYRKGLRDKLIAVAGRLTAAGLLFLLGALSGALLIALDVILARGLAIAIAAFLAVLFLVLWYVLPAWIRASD